MNLATMPPKAFRTIHGQVIDALGHAITAGEYEVGEALPQESVLCVQLGVSRGALREAVKGIVAKGMLEIGPRTGTRVLPKSRWNMLDGDVLVWLSEVDRHSLVIHLNELRTLIEPGAARWTAERATLEEKQQVLEEYAAMADAAQQGDASALTAADVRFHHALLAFSQNPLLAALNEPLHIALHSTFEVTIEADGAIGAAVTMHLGVAEVVLAGDGDRAARAMSELIDVSILHFQQVRARAL